MLKEYITKHHMACLPSLPAAGSNSQVDEHDLMMTHLKSEQSIESSPRRASMGHKE